jgi:hypothetical protein
MNMAAGRSFFAVKWLGHETDQSPSSGDKVKDMWIYTSTPQYVSYMVHNKAPVTTLPLHEHLKRVCVTATNMKLVHTFYRLQEYKIVM